MKELKNLLKEFGLTSNASKAYIALLRKSPSTGYEISGQADIPRSAIYNVLSRLVNMGLASSVGKDPRRYIPLPASSLIDSLHNKHNKRMDKLKSAIKDIDQNDEAFDFWHLHGYDNMIEKAKEVILPLVEAGKEVHLNLKDVSYMDSSGISVLIESHQKALEKNTKVVVKEVSKSVLKVIMMAKLEQILNLE